MRVPLVFATLALILALVSVLDERTATAAGEGLAGVRARAAELFQKAEREDEAYDFAAALAHYDEARALDPSSRFAPRAEARAAVLRAHAEGGFAPFARLERVRRDPALAADRDAVAALVRDAEAFPPGPTRVEAWMLAAEGDANRFGRPDDAIALFRRVLAEPGADPVLAKKAARDLVALSLARGDLAGAKEALRLAGDRGDAKLASDVARAARRRFVHGASILVLAATALLALRGVVTGARRGARVGRALRKIAPLALGYAAYVGVTGALLATGYEAGTALPFLAFGGALVPLLALARAWGAAGSPAASARVLRAALAASSALAAAFLVLERIDVAYLAGIGL